MILRVEDIHTYYGDAYVLQGLSLEVGEGQIVGLLGRNGVGKTTLVSSIVGFNRPRRGRIVFKGADITRLNSFETVRKGMGLVPQGRRVFASLTVEENLRVARSKTGAWSLKRVYELFPRLEERRRQRAKTLSGGEQQMLAIARVMMAGARLILMDEPTQGLAPALIRHIRDMIRELVRLDITVLLVEQNARVALSVCDRGYIMEKGVIVFEGPSAELRASPVTREKLGV